jgi:hypothetical protein
VKFAAAVVACLISAFALSDASAQEPTCRFVRAVGAGFVEDCGKQLNAFRLILLEAKLGSSGVRRDVLGDMHGRFSFPCPVEPICGYQHEPFISGFFVSAEQWNSSPKDEQAIYQAVRSNPLMRGGPPPQMPPAACSVFDVVIDGMRGRGVCLGVTDVKGGNIVVVVAADDRVGLALSFQQYRSAGELRDEVLELMPRFKIERATGDSVLEWFR